jgi:hypothetical protein
VAGAVLGVASFALAYRDRLPADRVIANLREIEHELD